MIESTAEDLLSLDQDVARAAGNLARWRAELAAHGARDLAVVADREDPFESVRHVAGQSLWDALQRLSLAPAEAMHRDALRRWVYALMQARIGLVFEIAMVRAKAEPTGRFVGPPPRLVSFADAWRGVLVSTSAGQANEWLRAAADAAPLYADLGRRRAARRVDVALRLGLEHPWIPLVGVAPVALSELAVRVLDATEDLWRHVQAQAPQSKEVAASVFRRAVARDAGEGWPGSISMAWLASVTGMAEGRVELEVQSLPAPLGASSFLRALYAAGCFARISLGRCGLPFSLAEEPVCVAGHRWGLAFASLGTSIDWQVRELGLGKRTASAQVRSATYAALFELRLQAARVLLGDDASPSPEALFEELCVRLVGVPLDTRLRGAWPSRREDDPARMIAWVQAPSFIAGLRDTFDLDWYRNPRALSHMRDSRIPSGP